MFMKLWTGVLAGPGPARFCRETCRGRTNPIAPNPGKAGVHALKTFLCITDANAKVS
jgi:hypothetical protein